MIDALTVKVAFRISFGDIKSRLRMPQINLADACTRMSKKKNCRPCSGPCP